MTRYRKSRAEQRYAVVTDQELEAAADALALQIRINTEEIDRLEREAAHLRRDIEHNQATLGDPDRLRVYAYVKFHYLPSRGVEL